MSLNTDLLRALPQRKEEVWQGGLVRLPAWMHDPPGQPPWRPWGVIWISARTRLVGMNKPDSSPVHAKDYPAVLETLLSFAQETAHCRPAALEVKDPVLAERLGRVLASADIEVRLCSGLPALQPFLRELEEDFSGPIRVSGALSVPGVTVERMRAFAEAAREFYEARPWRFLSSDDDVIRIESPTPLPELRYLLVMGMGGLDHGLAFFSSSEHLRSMFEMEPDEFFTKSSGWSVDFDTIDFLPFADADLFEDHGLAVVTSNAYPLAKKVGPKLKVRRPDATVLAFFEGILRVLAHTSETEIDSGEWTRTVNTFDGPQDFTLALPQLIESDHTPPMENPRIFDSRLKDRMMTDIERILEGHEFGSPEEAQKFLDRELKGKPIPHLRPRTPLDEAQDLVYEALEQPRRRKLQLARKALELSPDCADAYVILAENSSDIQKTRRLYQEGLEAGERALGPDIFKESAGDFWGITRTRPYMRARLGLAQTLETLGETEEALRHYRELIRLNPHDNQGVRHLLMTLLLQKREDDELRDLFAKYPDDAFATSCYARVLDAFQRTGDSPETRELLDDAMNVNPHVIPYLLGKRDFPTLLPDYHGFGDEAEGVLCAELMLDAWDNTEGALEWLADRTAKRKTPPKRGKHKQR